MFAYPHFPNSIDFFFGEHIHVKEGFAELDTFFDDFCIIR